MLLYCGGNNKFWSYIIFPGANLLYRIRKVDCNHLVRMQFHENSINYKYYKCENSCIMRRIGLAYIGVNFGIA
jgi:hypothetical protein